MAEEKASPTQEFVPIKEVRNGIVILKDGSLRAILMTSSMNFALKSEDEQASVLMQFQNFLNSLDFTVQIFIQSRNLDIRPYITLLEERYKAQTNDLMRIQIREYIDFVKNFVEGSNIMSKNFFVVVPYTPPMLSTGSEGSSALNALPVFGKKGQATAEEKSLNFEENRSQLEQRISVVEQGMLRTGIRVVQLGTEEVIELFYKIFNPGELEKPIPLNQ
jgi:type IV secretory pathway VirB4 component